MSKTYKLQWITNAKDDLLNIVGYIVYIMAILDSRQNIEELLLQKLLKG